MLSSKIYSGTNRYVQSNPVMQMWEWIDNRLRGDVMQEVYDAVETALLEAWSSGGEFERGGEFKPPEDED